MQSDANANINSVIPD